MIAAKNKANVDQLKKLRDIKLVEKSLIEWIKFLQKFDGTLTPQLE